jgi:hypothetical protein
MNRLVREKIERAGLMPWLEARADQRVLDDPALGDHLAGVDLLSLGAAADLARRRECGDEARIYIPRPPPSAATTLIFGRAENARGSSLLRKIASLRLTSPIGTRLVVDFGVVGLEIAQIALSFGATDLAGPIASRRGLPMADADDSKKLVKRREIAGFVERAGFRPVFVAADAAESSNPPEAEVAPVRNHVES